MKSEPNKWHQITIMVALASLPPPPPFFNEVNIAKGNNNEQIYKSFNEDINAISESRRLSAKSEFRK